MKRQLKKFQKIYLLVLSILIWKLVQNLSSINSKNSDVTEKYFFSRNFVISL